MSKDMLFALMVFSFVASITPGPNNFMLLASGVNFGFQRSIPHMAGITIGFVVLLLGVGFGLGALLTAFPPLHLALKIAGAAYLVYLAYRIAMSRNLGDARGPAAEPMSFMQAAAFQWVNPKGWAMAISAVAIYTSPQTPVLSILLICAVFPLVGLPCIAAWTGFGMMLRGFLSDPVRLKWFNIAMGLLLVATLWPMLG